MTKIHKKPQKPQPGIDTIFPRFLTPAEVQSVLNISDETFARLIDEGRLVAVRVRKHVRVSEEELRRFIAANRTADHHAA